ncbi:MAG: hypothetical protein KDC71_12515 [Acidobacteria bacterium]|nr:hypothetical protein [Acidobacteriota bacterium]
MRKHSSILKGTHHWHGFLVFGCVSDHLRTLQVAWKPGAHLYQHDEALLLLWHETQREIPPYPALGLVQSGSHFFAYPPEKTPETKTCIYFSRAGQSQAVPLGQWQKLELADYESLEFLAIETLVPVPLTKNKGSERLKVPPQKSAKEVFRLDPDLAGNPLLTEPGKKSPNWLTRLFDRTPATDGAGTPTGTTGTPKGPGLLKSLMDRLILTSGLWLRLTRSQQKYLDGMIEKFRLGEFEEALRRAIPMAKPDQDWGGFAWGNLSPRSQLQFSGGSGPTRTLLPWNGLGDLLRATYLKALEELKKRGAHRQAAYILAELLNDVQGAIRYLESVREYALAIEIALLKKQPPADLIRLYLLDGQTQPALLLARQYALWDSTILQLEKKDLEAANFLRLHAARHFAHQAKYRRAIEFALPLADAGALIDRWIEMGLTEESQDQAYCLAQRFHRQPDHFEDPLLRQWIEGPELDKMAMFLENVQPHPKQVPICRTALRHLFANHEALAPSFRHLLNSESKTGDSVLDWDRPKELPAAKREHESPIGLIFETTGGLSQPLVKDMVPLAHGRWLVSLAGTGIGVFAADGRLRTLDPFTFETFIQGDRTHLGLNLTADAIEVRRWSPSGLGKSKPLLEATCFAPLYDGEFWAVAHQTNLALLDSLSPTGQVVWGVDTDYPILELAFAQKKLLAWVASPEPQVWVFELPLGTLRHRCPVSFEGPSALFPMANAACWVQETEGGRQLNVKNLASDTVTSLPIECEGQLSQMVVHKHLWLVFREGEGLTVLRYHHAPWKLAGTYRFPNCERLIIRENEQGCYFMNEWGFTAQISSQGALIQTSHLKL